MKLNISKESTRTFMNTIEYIFLLFLLPRITIACLVDAECTTFPDACASGMCILGDCTYVDIPGCSGGVMIVTENYLDVNTVGTLDYSMNEIENTVSQISTIFITPGLVITIGATTLPVMSTPLSINSSPTNRSTLLCVSCVSSSPLFSTGSMSFGIADVVAYGGFGTFVFMQSGFVKRDTTRIKRALPSQTITINNINFTGNSLLVIGISTPVDIYISDCTLTRPLGDQGVFINIQSTAPQLKIFSLTTCNMTFLDFNTNGFGTIQLLGGYNIPSIADCNIFHEQRFEMDVTCSWVQNQTEHGSISNLVLLTNTNAFVLSAATCNYFVVSNSVFTQNNSASIITLGISPTVTDCNGQVQLSCNSNLTMSNCLFAFFVGPLVTCLDTSVYITGSSFTVGINSAVALGPNAKKKRALYKRQISPSGVGVFSNNTVIGGALDVEGTMNITYNTFTGSLDYGISILSSDSSVISGNNVSLAHENGIIVVSTSNILITGNTILGNGCGNVNVGPNSGISILDDTTSFDGSAFIIANTITNNNAHGIYIDSARVFIVNNTIEYNGGNGVFFNATTVINATSFVTHYENAFFGNLYLGFAFLNSTYPTYGQETPHGANGYISYPIVTFNATNVFFNITDISPSSALVHCYEALKTEPDGFAEGLVFIGSYNISSLPGSGELAHNSLGTNFTITCTASKPNGYSTPSGVYDGGPTDYYFPNMIGYNTSEFSLDVVNVSSHLLSQCPGYFFCPNSVCGMQCINLTSDSLNCGACGKGCGPLGTFCVNGSCNCTTSKAKQACGVWCIDLTSDPNNCGNCGEVCQSGICNNGTCMLECVSFGTSTNATSLVFEIAPSVLIATNDSLVSLSISSSSESHGITNITYSLSTTLVMYRLLVAPTLNFNDSFNYTVCTMHEGCCTGIATIQLYGGSSYSAPPVCFPIAFIAIIGGHIYNTSIFSAVNFMGTGFYQLFITNQTGNGTIFSNTSVIQYTSPNGGTSDGFVYTACAQNSLCCVGIGNITLMAPPATTALSTTAVPTTSIATTAAPTTAKPTTAAPTTAKPTTAQPTTAQPTTAQPTTAIPTTGFIPTTTGFLTTTFANVSSTNINTSTQTAQTLSPATTHITKPPPPAIQLNSDQKLTLFLISAVFSCVSLMFILAIWTKYYLSTRRDANLPPRRRMIRR